MIRICIQQSAALIMICTALSMNEMLINCNYLDQTSERHTRSLEEGGGKEATYHVNR